MKWIKRSWPSNPIQLRILINEGHDEVDFLFYVFSMGVDCGVGEIMEGDLTQMKENKKVGKWA